jgi:hypothetical protein
MYSYLKYVEWKIVHHIFSLTVYDLPFMYSKPTFGKRLQVLQKILTRNLASLDILKNAAPPIHVEHIFVSNGSSHLKVIVFYP